ncbi:YczI family protein [Ornithinibacillus xuwenensis]|uniref:YczI family protein n=1 Tax=Ornithinibacillus xuwenensis TaxID=3144668 RepID=A0ABU9XGX8_9BACI
MLKMIRISLAVVIIILSIYILLTDNFDMLLYSNTLLGLLLFVIGLEELKKEKKGFGYLGIFASIFAFFVSIQLIFFN